MMRRKTLALGVGVAICAAATLASADPTLGNILKKGQDYAAARHALQAASWRPVLTDDRDADGTRVKSWGDTREMADAGMVEVERCAGTGLNFCEFWWRKGSSCLHIITYGEYLPERGSPRVNSYSVEACKDLSAHDK